jgi:hypothetical protein
LTAGSDCHGELPEHNRCLPKQHQRAKHSTVAPPAAC